MIAKQKRYINNEILANEETLTMNFGRNKTPASYDCIIIDWFLVRIPHAAFDRLALVKTNHEALVKLLLKRQ